MILENLASKARLLDIPMDKLVFRYALELDNITSQYKQMHDVPVENLIQKKGIAEYQLMMTLMGNEAYRLTIEDLQR